MIFFIFASQKAHTAQHRHAASYARPFARFCLTDPANASSLPNWATSPAVVNASGGRLRSCAEIELNSPVVSGTFVLWGGGG